MRSDQERGLFVIGCFYFKNGSDHLIIGGVNVHTGSINVKLANIHINTGDIHMITGTFNFQTADFDVNSGRDHEKSEPLFLSVVKFLN